MYSNSDEEKISSRRKGIAGNKVRIIYYDFFFSRRVLIISIYGLRFYQKNTDLLIRKLPFARLVREVQTYFYRKEFRYRKTPYRSVTPLYLPVCS